MVNEATALPAPALPPASADLGVPARAFDGRSTQPQAVVLHLAGSTLHVQAGPGESRPYAVAQLRVGEAYAGSACPVRLPDGGTLWLDPTPAALALARALRQATGGPGWVARAMARWPLAALALVVLVVVLVWFSHTGAGLAARAALPLVPVSIDREIGQRAWATIDRQWLSPTRHAARCEALAQRFAAAVQAFDAAARLPPLQCRRTEGAAGFNAFALPNGQIVLLDGLVEALNDDQLMAVLGHELAHVRERHAMQGLMRQMGLLAVAGAALGDFSTLAATTLAGLQGLAYSRSAEREADAQALQFLASAGLPAELWAQVWQRFAEEEARSGGGLPGWMSSHPPTEERLRLGAPSPAAPTAPSQTTAQPPPPLRP